jgi:hypothetical protein
VVHGGRARGEAIDAPRVVQRTNLRGAGKRVLEVLGVSGNVEKSDDTGLDVTLYVGRQLEASSVLQTPDLWPDVPERKVTEIPRSDRPRRRRYRGSGEERVQVRVRESQPEASESEAPAGEPETPMEIPGTAEPETKPAPAPATSPAPAPAPVEPKKPSTDAPGTE